jgi:tRNA (guanine6-N2)-methyltransferase
MVQTLPGLESVAWSEIAARCQPRVNSGSLRHGGNGGARPLPARELARRLVPGRNGITIFTAPSPAPLKNLRTAEDVFAIVGCRDELTNGADALDRIRAAARDVKWLENAINNHGDFIPGSRAGRRLHFKVIARMAGEHPFTRAEMARAVARGIAERDDHKWRAAKDGDVDIEFWATMIDGELLIAVRLSGETMRHREYKVAHLPGSLRPSVAAALNWLAAPSAEDTLLDPFCGTGTILIERAHFGRYRMLLGSDRDPEALRAASENIGPRYKPLELHSWDATTIPLADGSIDKIVTNLPWGMRHGSRGENRRLYPRFITEFLRLVRPGGLIVMLTAEMRLMAQLMTNGLFRADHMLHLNVLGAPAAIYICRRP